MTCDAFTDSALRARAACRRRSLSASAQAQDKELRIGLIAPMTGILAQVGKDMVDGLNMYLEEAKGDFAGAKVKVIVEDSQAKPDTAVTKAKKLILQDKVHMLLGGVLATEGYALAPVSTNDKTVYIASCRRPTISPSATCRSIRTSSAPAGRVRSRITRSGNGPASRATRRSSPSPPTTRSVTNPSAASRRRSRIAAGRIVQKIWPPLGTKDFGPFIPTIKADADAIFTLMVGPMVLQFPKQLRQRRLSRSRSSAAARATTSSRCRSWATR